MYSKRSRSKPRLERRNAAKHIDYDAASFSSSLDDTSSSSSLITRSLDLSDKTSFRIQGTEGEFDLICRTLGLSGPEDFSIPAAAWESRKIRSSSDLLPRSRLNRLDSPEEETGKIILEDGTRTCWVSNVVDGGGNYGIKGIRPPGLKPPPVMKLPVVDSACSTWDLFRDFAPEDDKGCTVQVHLHSSSDEEEVKGEKDRGNEENAKEEDNSMRIGETAVLSESCSFITSNDDDSSSSTTEPMSNISPNGRFKRTITYWEKGELLGRGSFGSVFEGISDHFCGQIVDDYEPLPLWVLLVDSGLWLPMILCGKFHADQGKSGKTKDYPYLKHMQALFRIGRGEPPAVPDSLSKDARDFVLQCLQVNPDARPTAAKLLQHPFVKRSFPTHSGSASPHLGRRI
ncbi:hypothetical protein GOBAR_DD34662 [Gossypium barbadense]|nr:hypothetical protein GOBAR_DD34662 [Gossypium barbadense]